MARDRENRRLLRIEPLEQRALLSATAVFDLLVYNPIRVGGSTASPANTSPTGYTPAQIQTAYGIGSISLGGVSGTGAGQTIAIIDAYNDPDITSDAATFSSQFSLQQFNVSGGPTLKVLNQTGGSSLPGTDPDGPASQTGKSTWEEEESLDVEWAHAVAPKANIILFEANNASTANLMTAVKTAAAYAGVSVVSMSWGSSESSGETSYDSYFTTPSGHANVTFLASTGDDGSPGGYPAYSPNVISCGGTTLYLNSNNTWESETAWSDSGGGESSYEKTEYQESVQTSGYRETPNVSFDANPSTGVAICDSYDYSSSPWLQIGGTSVSAPCWSGLIAIADQFRASEGLSLLNGPSVLYALSNPYTNSYFHDITSGSNGGHSAGTGYDMVTGIGSPIANNLVPALAPSPAPDMTVAMTDSGSGTFYVGDVGDTFTITVTNSGTSATSGTVSVAVTLPTGLTATGWSGTGWSMDLLTLTASRSDSLASGASYSALTLTVDVASSASGSVTTTATVSGGGETNTSNDTATDTTTISPAAPLITSVTPSLSGGTLTAGATTLTITFNEAVTGAAAASNYELRGVGPDGLFDTADDVLVSLSISYSDDIATLTFAGLTEGVYRLTVFDAIANGNGVKLDGDGTAGSNWVTDFVVVPSGTLLGSASTVSLSGSDPLSVATGDFTGNGELDLVVADAGTSTVEVLLNNGNGTFTDSSSYSIAYHGYYGYAVPYAVTVGDFNGDGKLDFAVANFDQTYGSGTIEVFLGNGNGTFTFSSEYQGAGNGTGFDPISIVAADFNGDGKLDLAVANYYKGLVDVITGNGNGTFSTTPATYSSGGSDPRALVVADFTGDGHPDLAVANYGSNTVGVLLNTGSGTFASAVTYSTGGSEPRSLAAGDLTGGGHPDLVVGNYSSGTVGILLNKGNGTFSSVTTYSSGGTDPRGVALADFTGDGSLDVVVTNSGSSTIGVLLNKGNGTFSAATTFSTGSSSGPFGVTVGDFNGDGKPDVAVTNASTNTVAVLLDTYGPGSLTLTTPDGFSFAVAAGVYGTGEFVTGTGSSGFSGESNAFNGYGRLYVGGSLFSPTAATYSTANSGQSLILGSGTAAGLTVSREITVPDTGSQDFARTVDTFTNSTGSSITTTVQIIANLGSGADTTVFDTSNGDTTVDTSDQWIGTDGNGTPAIITYIDGPLSLQPTSVTLSDGQLQWTYTITVAAGASVNLAYFTIVATTSTAAVTEANALVGSSGFGGQAGAFLSTSELQSLANFANTATVLTPPPSPTAGTAISDANLFHFTDTSANASLSNYTATITWGDGTVSTVTSTASSGGQIVADANGGFDVLGSHVYTSAILSPVTLSVAVSNGAGTITASDSSFTVADAPLTAGALTTPAGIVGSFSDVAVFHFSDANSYVTAGDFSAVITWGDGTSSTVTGTASAGGQIVADAGGGFDVLGAHDYTAALSGATFGVQVSDDDGSGTGASQSGFSVAAVVASAQAVSSLDLSAGTTLVIAAGGTLTAANGVEIGSGATLEIESGGTLILSSLVQGTGAATVLLDGGTLEAAAAFTSAMPIEIGAGGATVDTDGYDVTLAGNLSDAAGAGSLIKTGAGMLTLSGTNTYTGGTTILAGAVDVTSPSAAASDGALTIDSGGLLILGSLIGGGDAAPADASTTTPAATSTATSDAGSTILNKSARVAAASSSTATDATTAAAATSADPTSTATATATAPETTPATATPAATDTTAPVAASPSTATATAAATIAVAAATPPAGAPVETSLPPSGLESSVNVDVSRSQANASPATVASSDAKVEGSGQNRPGTSVGVILSHPEAYASGSMAATAFATSVAADDHARAHDFVLQSGGVGSSGIEALRAAGGPVHGSDRLHPPKRTGSVEAILDAALVSLVI